MYLQLKWRDSASFYVTVRVTKLFTKKMEEGFLFLLTCLKRKSGNVRVPSSVINVANKEIIFFCHSADQMLHGPQKFLH